MSIYTFLIVAMLLAVAFNKDHLFMVIFILYLVLILIEAMAENNQPLEIKIMIMVVFLMICWLGFKQTYPKKGSDQK